jgi:hypothetical protein
MVHNVEKEAIVVQHRHSQITTRIKPMAAVSMPEIRALMVPPNIFCAKNATELEKT